MPKTTPSRLYGYGPPWSISLSVACASFGRSATATIFRPLSGSVLSEADGLAAAQPNNDAARVITSIAITTIATIRAAFGLLITRRPATAG